MRSDDMVNICLNDNFRTPTVCNAHNEARKCVCRFNPLQAYYGTHIVSCDRLFDIEDDTRHHHSFYSTAVYNEIYNGPPEALDEMILSDLESFLDLDSGTLVMLRKFCMNKKLHVQFCHLKNASRNPIFSKDDLIISRWNSAEFNRNIKLQNGVLAKDQEWLQLIPITESSDNLPLDATVFTVS